MYNPNKYEGFEQDQRFVVMRDEQIYDEFYVELYDTIMKPELRSDFEIAQILKWTQPSKTNSIILDIGCGSCYITNQLASLGYNIYGLDKSPTMIEHAKEKYPQLKLQCDDITKHMLFDNGSFTHILCTNMTIYQFKDKLEFFSTCYHQLMTNGYLIIHLVDKDQFDTIVPGGKSHLISSPQSYVDTRITDTNIDFIDFKYHASYDFPKTSSEVVFREKMTDTATNNIRENEQTLYMKPVKDILVMAQTAGFILHGQANMSECIGDKHQYLYIFERPM